MITCTLPPPRRNPFRPGQDLHIHYMTSADDGCLSRIIDLQPTADAGLIEIVPVPGDAIRGGVRLTALGALYWSARASADDKARLALLERFGVGQTHCADDAIALLALSNRFPDRGLADLRAFLAMAGELALDWRQALGIDPLAQAVQANAAA